MYFRIFTGTNLVSKRQLVVRIAALKNAVPSKNQQ